MEQMSKKIENQDLELKDLKAKSIKQQEILDLTYAEVRKLRKKIDSFLSW